MRRLTAACFLAVSLLLVPTAQAASPLKHTVTTNDGHHLALWEKQPASPKGAILLLHGRTWSALPNFDLQVEGTPRSVLDALTAAGYAAYALDQRGYGQSPRDASGWLTPSRAAQDALDTVAFIRALHPQLPAPAVVGYSQGSLTALLAAQQSPEAFSALVLYGFPGDIDVLRPADTGNEKPARARTTLAAAAEDFVTPRAASRAVIDAYARQAVKADPVRADWRQLDGFRFEPARVTTPTLLLHGVNDGYLKGESLAKLFNRLASPDRSWVVLPDSDHAAHVENQHAAWIRAILDFVERPRPALEKE